MANSTIPDTLPSIQENPVKVSESETMKSQDSIEETLTEIPEKIPNSETSGESVQENLTAKMTIGTSEAKMPIGREKKEEREILAASPSVPDEDVVSLAWKEMVDDDLNSIHISIDALGKRTEKMEQNSVQISNDRLQKVEQDLKLHHEVILKITENLEDVKKSTLSKKITSSVTVLLLALTVLIGYNIALFVLGKKCMPYLSGLLILNLLGICSFGWVALATILESIASDKNGVDGTNETGGDATGENGNKANEGDGNGLTATLLSQGRKASTSKYACISILPQLTEASASKYAWVPIIVVCLYAMAHTLAGFLLMVYCQ